MKEYFVLANSCAAPFVSDTSHHYVKGDSPQDAMDRFVAAYDHPAGLFAANLYSNADAMHKNKPPLHEWRSEKAVNA